MIVLSVQMRVWMMLAAAAMTYFCDPPHPRGEELGRLELLRSLPVAKLTGAVAVFAHAAR
jgi:putative exporter of polyketide antibiotics